MKSVFTIIVMWGCIHLSWSQTFTESAFFVSKTITDTSENVNMLETCGYTYERLLKGTPSDSLIQFYDVINQTKMAYLVLETVPADALHHIDNAKARFTHIDTTFRFGNESAALKLFQKIIVLKANKTENQDLINLEKEVERFYLTNKQSARAHLVYAFYMYHFDRMKKQKTVENLLKTSITLFDKEKKLNLSVNWGKNLALNLLAKIKR